MAEPFIGNPFGHVVTRKGMAPSPPSCYGRSSRRLSGTRAPLNFSTNELYRRTLWNCRGARPMALDYQSTLGWAFAQGGGCTELSAYHRCPDLALSCGGGRSLICLQYSHQRSKEW